VGIASAVVVAAGVFTVVERIESRRCAFWSALAVLVVPRICELMLVLMAYAVPVTAMATAIAAARFHRGLMPITRPLRMGSSMKRWVRAANPIAPPASRIRCVKVSGVRDRAAGITSTGQCHK
jgi:hypothetical protein